MAMDMVVFSFMLSLLVLTSTRLIFKFIWRPFHVQSMMKSQGIKGPSYKFIYGSTKEGLLLKERAKNNPNDLSHDIFHVVQPTIYSWKKLYGNNFVTWDGPNPRVVITEPELAKEILSNKEGIFTKIKIEGSYKKLFGDSIIISEGKKWSKLRKIANHAFYAESLKGMFPAMVDSAETMLENWRRFDGKEMEAYKEFNLMSSEVICRTAFGSSYLEGKNVFDMLTKLTYMLLNKPDKILLPFGLEKIWKSKEEIELEKVETSLRDSILEIVKKRERNVHFGSDFLGSLLRAHHDHDKDERISIDDVIDECKAFFFAGQETTSGLLTWTVLVLAIHVDWQEKARQEVFQLFGIENPKPEGLSRLKMVTMIINEVLRLYSPASNIMRRSKRNATIGKYEFPANVQLHISTLALHVDEEIWGTDANLFKPERFEQGVASATKNNPMAFLPFGFGPRICVGMNFAYNEVKITLSMILQRYKFTLSPNYVHKPVELMTIKPQYGLLINLQKI